MPKPKYWTQRRDLKKAQQKLGTPKTDMFIEPGIASPAPAPKKKAPKPGSQEFLNKENDYDKNTYTPEDMIKRGVLTRRDPYLSRA